MSGNAKRLRCRECDVELNRHAAKIVDPRDAEEAGRVDPDLGGLLLESHSCPECGKSQFWKSF